MLGAAGAQILAAFMSTKLFEAKGSLSRLDVSRNRLCGVYLDGRGREKGTYDATGLTALTKSIGNLKELNISNNQLRAEGAKILVPALQDSGSLSKLTFCGNGGAYGSEGDAVTMDTTMTEADFSGKKLGAAGAKILAAFMSTKLFEAKGSLVSLNLAQNDLGVEGAKHVAEVVPKW
jgi:hypothetical protein